MKEMSYSPADRRRLASHITLFRTGRVFASARCVFFELSKTRTGVSRVSCTGQNLWCVTSARRLAESQLAREEA